VVLFVLFVLVSNAIFLEVIVKYSMVVALKRTKLTINEKLKIIQALEQNPAVLRNETVKCSVLSPLLLSNMIL
jgi:hypothetical protein